MGSEAAAPGQGNNWTRADTHRCEAPSVPGTSARDRCLPRPRTAPGTPALGGTGGAGLSRGVTRRTTSAAHGPGKGPTGPSDPAGFVLQRCCCSPQRAATAAPPRDRPCSRRLSLCITGFCPPASRCSRHMCPQYLDIHPPPPFPAPNTPSAPSPAVALTTPAASGHGTRRPAGPLPPVSPRGPAPPSPVTASGGGQDTVPVPSRRDPRSPVPRWGPDRQQQGRRRSPGPAGSGIPAGPTRPGDQDGNSAVAPALAPRPPPRDRARHRPGRPRPGSRARVSQRGAPSPPLPSLLAPLSCGRYRGHGGGRCR